MLTQNKMQKERKKSLVALKLDINKAYDKIEWSFLEYTIKKMRFFRRWIELVMKCITTLTFFFYYQWCYKRLYSTTKKI